MGGTGTDEKTLERKVVQKNITSNLGGNMGEAGDRCNRGLSAKIGRGKLQNAKYCLQRGKGRGEVVGRIMTVRTGKQEPTKKTQGGVGRGEGIQAPAMVWIHLTENTQNKQKVSKPINPLCLLTGKKRKPNQRGGTTPRRPC